ncbi:carbohydrate porin [Colwellia sp. D2M02]|uniref:carbohydrate porin n=1 Tax=Colwellia sp. D2M02 TaxID=2841562 RepID=UPI001C09A4C3|nr:carbohydrate porin [Colwellia sp. D2M02]MBU2893176.1 carbohydrate porin [Colwellia sp. D2M02]
MVRKSCLTLSAICLYVSTAYSHEFTATVVNDASNVVSGGVNETSAVRTLVNASALFNLSEHYSFYADGALLRGDDGGLDTGAIQAYSNIDEAEFEDIYEVWFEGNYQEQGLRFKLGQIDANSEFAFIEHGGEFIHSSMGFTPTIAFMPTYPMPTLAGAINWQATESGNIAFGFFSDDSNEFDEVFYIAEWAQRFNNVVAKIGVWHQTGDIETFTVANHKEGTEGAYMIVEGSLDNHWLSSQSSSWFAQMGYADDEVSELNFHFGAGIAWYAPFNRAGDKTGIGVNHVSTSHYLHNELQKSETAYEVFYRFQVNDYLAFKPDIQYIVSPATDKSLDNVLVVTLRTEITF